MEEVLVCVAVVRVLACSFRVNFRRPKSGANKYTPAQHRIPSTTIPQHQRDMSVSAWTQQKTRIHWDEANKSLSPLPTHAHACHAKHLDQRLENHHRIQQ